MARMLESLSPRALQGHPLAGVPGVLTVLRFLERIALGGHQRGYALAEFRPDPLHGDGRILHGIVQGRGRQEFLVRGHRGDDFHRLHRMYDIRETLAATLRPGVGPDREHDRAVQQIGIKRTVCHWLECMPG